jgi:hypothetical protein
LRSSGQLDDGRLLALANGDALGGSVATVGQVQDPDDGFGKVAADLGVEPASLPPNGGEGGVDADVPGEVGKLLASGNELRVELGPLRVELSRFAAARRRDRPSS